MEEGKDGIRISIIVPVYNMQKYLGRALESILAQTFRDYEVILVDDGSTDASASICEEYAQDYGFTLLRQKNSGVSVARNRGLESAHGKWVTFLDPDDYWEPEFLKTLYTLAKKPADVVAMGCLALGSDAGEPVHFFSGDINFSDTPQAMSGFSGREKYELLCELMDVNYGAERKRPTGIGVPWGKLYRRKFLNKNGLRFDPELFRMQDNIFNMQVFEAARTVLYVDRFLYVYNLEHIHRYTVEYNPRAAGAFERVCGLRYRHLKETKRMKDSQLRDLYEREAQKLAFWILTCDILHKDNAEDDDAKVRRMKRIFREDAFRKAFERIRETDVPKKQKKMLKLLKKEQYRKLLVYAQLSNKKAELKGS